MTPFVAYLLSRQDEDLVYLLVLENVSTCYGGILERMVWFSEIEDLCTLQEIFGVQ